jgi:predicted transcriptional regulator
MILESAADGNSKTRIMTGVGLSYFQLEEYLETSLKSGILELDSSKTYRTTEKGRQYLKLYHQINELIDIDLMPTRKTLLKAGNMKK